MFTSPSKKAKKSNDYVYCDIIGHTKKIRDIICYNEDCPSKGFICTLCLFTLHREHFDQCIDVDIIKTNNLLTTVEINSKVNFIMDEAVSKIKVYVKSVKEEVSEILGRFENKTIVTLKDIKLEHQNNYKTSEYNDENAIKSTRSQLESLSSKSDRKRDIRCESTSHDINETRMMPVKFDVQLFEPRLEMNLKSKELEEKDKLYLEAIKQKEEEIALLEKENETLIQNSMKLSLKMQNLEKIIEEKEFTTKEFEASKQSILDKITNEKLKCMVENENLKKEMENKVKQIIELTMQHEELASDVMKMTKDLSDELEKKQEEINLKSKDILKLNEILANIKKDFEKLNNDIGILKGSNDYLRKKLENREANADDVIGNSYFLNKSKDIHI